MEGRYDDAVYDVTKVNVILAGRIITGFASEGVVTVSKNEDSVIPSVGAKGDVAYSENANESATMTMNLMSTSSSLPYLRQLVAKRAMINVSISDANDSTEFFVNEDNCRVLKMPDLNRGKEQASVPVTVYIPHLTVR